MLWPLKRWTLKAKRRTPHEGRAFHGARLGHCFFHDDIKRRRSNSLLGWKYANWRGKKSNPVYSSAVTCLWRFFDLTEQIRLSNLWYNPSWGRIHAFFSPPLKSVCKFEDGADAIRSGDWDLYGKLNKCVTSNECPKMKEAGKVSGISINDGYSTIQHESCSQNHKIDFFNAIWYHPYENWRCKLFGLK